MADAVFVRFDQLDILRAKCVRQKVAISAAIEYKSKEIVILMRYIGRERQIRKLRFRHGGLIQYMVIPVILRVGGAVIDRDLK